MEAIRVVHAGLGPIGRQIAAVAAQHAYLYSAAGLEIDPALIGKTMADLVPGAPRTPVVGSAADLPDAEVAILATTSHLQSLVPQVRALLERGLHVVSTCEELVWPYDQPALAREIDEHARAAGRSVLGVGINPGFIMDLVPVFYSAVVTQVEKVTVRRQLDLTRRRAQLQAKNGVGLPVEEVQPRAARNELGHVGLGASARLIAAAFGWPLTAIEQTNTALTSARPLRAQWGTVQPGLVVGIHQRMVAYERERPRIEMDLRMMLEENEELDEITLLTNTAGDDLTVRTRGIRGDAATVAIVLNSVKAITRVAPGLRTVLDVPPIHAS